MFLHGTQDRCELAPSFQHAFHFLVRDKNDLFQQIVVRSTTTCQWRGFILLTPFSAFGNASCTQRRASCSNLRYQKLADGEGLSLLWALLVQHRVMDSSAALIAGWEGSERGPVSEIMPFVLIKRRIMSVALKPCYSTWKEYFSHLHSSNGSGCVYFLVGVSRIIWTFWSSV